MPSGRDDRHTNRGILRTWGQSIGLLPLVARPDSAIPGPFILPATYVNAGAPNPIDYTTGTNLSDPGIVQEFGNGSPLANRPDVVLHLEQVELVIGDDGTIANLAALLDYMSKVFLSWTVSGTTRRVSLASCVGTVQDISSVSVLAAGPSARTIARKVFPLTLPNPIEVDLSQDGLSLSWSSAVVGVAADIPGKLICTGSAYSSTRYGGTDAIPKPGCEDYDRHAQAVRALGQLGSRIRLPRFGVR